MSRPRRLDLKVLVTGSGGFLATNLRVHLSERHDVEVICFNREDDVQSLAVKLSGVDFVFHLAGVNRTNDEVEFSSGNAELTSSLCQAMTEAELSVPIIYASSTQATLDNPYGRSKLAAEGTLTAFASVSSSPIYLFRLPNVFGKWSKPNYNSVVATFCYNISQNLPITVRDANAVVKLIYIDDVISHFVSIMDGAVTAPGFVDVQPVYQVTLGDLARKIAAFRESRENLVTEPVGSGFERALYATYLSYLQPAQFHYGLRKYEDQRGVFVEFLKTENSGQFSFFTAHPGVTRGGHYHHTKTEKFLVVKGAAEFRFRHILTNETYELRASAADPQVVETVPGWSHDITNVGDDELVAMLWASEVFDRQLPDTNPHKV